MASKRKYQLGTISKILSKTGEGSQKSDPKLVALFSSGATSNSFQTVKISPNQFSKKPQQDAQSRRKDRKVDKRLKGFKLTFAQLEGTTSTKKSELMQANELEKQTREFQEDEELVDVVTKKKAKYLKPGGQVKTESSRSGKPDVVPKNKRDKKLGKKKGKNVGNEDSQGSVDDDKDGYEAPQTQEESIVKTEKTIAERNAPKQKDPELEARTIFVGNLPSTIPNVKKKLKYIFKEFGNIESIRLRCAAPNKPTALKKVAINKNELHPENNTLAAYIRYSTREDAQNSVEKARGLIIDEHHIVVDLAESEKKDNKKAIFIGNLSLKLRDEDLWKYFEDCGTIVSVRIVRDNVTGLGKGFGYVNFDSKEAVELAIKKNQTELLNRTIRISRCVKKVKVKKDKKFPMRGPGRYAKNPKIPNDRTQRQDRSQQRFLRRKNVKDQGVSKARKWGKPRSKEVVHSYVGDRLAEVGKLKRKSNKPNRGDLQKARIAMVLTKPRSKSASSSPDKTLKKHKK